MPMTIREAEKLLKDAGFVEVNCRKFVAVRQIQMKLILNIK
ncbi:hypothetical protein IGK38_003008 [Enterococcus pernyi]